MLTLSVPGTTANLGPGYDVLGMALSLRNQFEFEPAQWWTAQGVVVDPASHLTLHTAVRAAAHFGAELSPLAVTQREEVPRARGLGSSATARVAGLHAALHFCGLEVPLGDRLQFLADEEGHPDNVVPAAVGGLTLCGQDAGRLVHLRFDAPALAVALCIPDREVSTAEARARIPAMVPHEDAVHNVAAVSFLLAGLVGGRLDAVALGLRDRLHQPHRAGLLGDLDGAFAAAIEAGALGAFVSGSGSTLAALVAADGPAAAVAEALCGPFRPAPGARAVVARPDNEGLREH